MIRVKQMINNNGYAVMNHFIIVEGNKRILQSYDSIVAIVDRDAEGSDLLTLGRDWDYSRTTMKYVHQFLQQTLGWDITAEGLRKAIKNEDINYDCTLH